MSITLLRVVYQILLLAHGYYDLYVFDVKNDNIVPAIIKNQVFVDEQTTTTTSATTVTTVRLITVLSSSSNSIFLILSSISSTS